MKLARILLVAVFMLSAAATSAAEASDRVVGFVPLLPRVDPNAPIAMQAQDALDSMMPRLLAAQKRGEILRFSPSLSVGVLKVLYTSAADTSMLFAGRPVYADMQHAVDSLELPRAAPPAPASGPGAEAAAYLHFYLFNNAFYGFNFPAGAHLIGVLKDKTGRLVSVADTYANSNGEVNGDFTWNGSYGDVLPGYTVQFRVLNGIQLLATYQAVAPSMRFTDIDKVNSIMSAAGPANKPVGGYWFHRKWDASNSYLSAVKSGTSSATGTWSLDFGSVPLRGHDLLDTWVAVNANFVFGRFMSVPYIWCELGGNYCAIYGFASTPAALHIVHAGTSYNFSGRFSALGWFSSSLETATGEPIFLVPGDSASGTSVPAYSFPNLTAFVNYTSDVISGKVPANKYFNLWAYVLATNTYYFVYSHSDSLGNYASDFTSQIDLQALRPMTAEIFYVNPVTGNTLDYLKSFAP
jgi:hypothetical protein